MTTLKAAFDQGVQEALAARKLDGDDEESHLARNLVVGGAAASPFLGMIGQKPVIHDPHLNPNIPRVNSMEDLAKMMQPGDTLMTSKPKGSLFKTFIAPTAGTEFYHAQPVVGRKRGKGITISAGENDAPGWRKSSIKDIMKATPTAEEAFKGEYPDVMIMRPKKQMTPQQTRKFVANSVQRSQKYYDNQKAVGTLLKDLFVPKIPGRENAQLPSICEGNVCSTMPAMAYAHAGGPTVAPGKPAQDVFPTDYLRSTEFEPVAAHIPSNYTMSPTMRRMMPYLSRGALGLGLGAGTYALSKDPALASIPLGAMAGGTIADLVAAGHNTELPNTLQFAQWMSDANPAEQSKLLKGYFGKRLPAMLGGAALSYAGTRALKNWLTSRARGENDEAAAPPA